MYEKASGWHRIINDNAFAGKGLSLALRFPSFLPDRFREVVFYWFYKVLGFPGPSGKGLKHSSLKEAILVDFGIPPGVLFGSILGSNLK